MLERFCRHISSGGRYLLRNRRQKRMLHSSFWLHGAEGLTPLLGSLSVCVGGILTAEVEALNRRILEGQLHLEFLYPSKTLAFLQQVSRHGLPSAPLVLSCRRQRSQCERFYSTGAKRVDGDLPKIFDSAKFLYKDLTSLLNKAAAEPTHYDEAWQHMQNELATANPVTINKTIEYLSSSDREVDRSRIMKLGKRMAIHDFHPAACEVVTKVLLEHGLTDDAYLLVSKVAENNPLTALKAVRRLIAYGVDKDRWIIAHQAFKLLPESVVDDTAPEKVIPGVHGFKSKYLAWLEEKPMEAYTPTFASWLGTGGIISALSRGTSEAAMEAYNILKAMHQNGWGARVSWSLWWSLMKQLQENAHYKAAADTYLIYRNTPLQESPPGGELAQLLYGTLKVFGHLEDFRNMERVFDDWFHFGSRPNEDACLYIMRQFASRGETSVIKDFFEYYVSRFPIRIGAIELMMHAHAVRGEVQEVVNWFQKIDRLKLSPTRVVYNILINAYKQADDIDSAFRHFYLMCNSRKELKPDLITYHTLMSLCASRGDIDACELLLGGMREQGLVANQAIYNAVTYAYVKQRSPEFTQQASIVANEAFKAMKFSEKRNNPTRMWNNILVGYLWAEDLNKIAATYNQMRSDNIPFDSYTYSILMHSLCLTGKVAEAERMLELLETEGIVILNQAHYATIMLDHMLRKEIIKVWLTYNRMLKAGFAPTFITQAILIQAVSTAEYREYRRSGGVLFLREAEAILAHSISDLSVLDLQSPDKVKSSIPPFLFVPLIQIYAREGSHERALELFQRFMEIQESKKPGNTVPDLDMYLHVANALLRSGDTKLLLAIWKEAKRAALRQAKRVDYGLFPTRQRKVVLPKHNQLLCNIFSVVIKALALDRDMPTLEWERDQLLHYGFQLDNVNVNDIVQALILNRKIVQAFTLCEKALIPGYVGRNVKGRGQSYNTPEFYPFMRTLECLLAEVHSYLNLPGYKGINSSKSERTIQQIEKSCPKTWQVLDELDSLEHRIVKERIFQQQRLDWGRQDQDRIWPSYDERSDNSQFVEELMRDLQGDMARRKLGRQLDGLDSVAVTQDEVLA
ncbi:hypothetical protein EV426DRAFT_145456 [Tirmania nivea]|nr:hypothetical protein EV426DRAFT_145456 [Tirmania nivea]